VRPVDRGLAPRTYAQYGDAIGDLEDRLGTYCSYCERRLPVSLAVEHMSPKSVHPDLELEWDNFLLGCTNCNSLKGDEDVSDDETLWPDRDNTLLAFAYSEGGFVRIGPGLTDDQRTRAQALIDLAGLDRHGAQGWNRPAARDKRWRQREEVWSLAEQCRTHYETLNRSDAALDLVTGVAAGYGFFSVWMTVFETYPKVRSALIETFPGTSQSCFDNDGEAVNRPGGTI